MPPRNPDRYGFLITDAIILITGFIIINIVILLPDNLTEEPKVSEV
jgi:hypothetical protein